MPPLTFSLEYNRRLEIEKDGGAEAAEHVDLIQQREKTPGLDI